MLTSEVDSSVFRGPGGLLPHVQAVPVRGRKKSIVSSFRKNKELEHVHVSNDFLAYSTRCLVIGGLLQFCHDSMFCDVGETSTNRFFYCGLILNSRMALTGTQKFYIEMVLTCLNPSWN